MPEIFNSRRKQNQIERSIRQKYKELNGTRAEGIMYLHVIAEALCILGYDSSSEIISTLVTLAETKMGRPELAMAKAFGNSLIERKEKGRVMVESQKNPKKSYYSNDDEFSCKNKVTLTRILDVNEISVVIYEGQILSNSETNESIGLAPDRDPVVIIN